MRQCAVVCLLLLCAGIILGVRHAPAMGSEALKERWAEAMRAKQWVTAFNDGSRKDRVPVRVDMLVVAVGGRESIVFRAGPEDIEIGGPIVSPDGTRLAFVKTSEERGRYRTAIYSMATDGSALRLLVELVPPTGPIKGAETGASPLAWSHDNRRIVVFGTPKDEARARGEPRFGTAEPESLFLLEVDSGRLVTLLSAIGRRVIGSGIGGPVITSQAWAPDNRRLVYMDDRGHVTILDSVTRSEQDLGPGVRPTWSPDGRFVAFQVPGGRRSQRDGDYVLVPVDAPSERAVLLSNARRLASFWGMGYTGAPIWSPDSRYVKLLYVPGEQQYYPYIFDRTTGEGSKLPFRSLGDSWGGKP